MISLQDYIDALFGSTPDYVQLTPHQTKVLESENWDPEARGYILEDNNDTIFPGTNVILPELTLGEKRLWYRESWEKYNGEEAKKEHKKWKIMQMFKAEMNK